VCAWSKGAPPRAHAPMEKVTAAAPMDLVAIDILSGLPTASDGSTCILVATDYMTKWTKAYPLPNKEASTCMTALYNNFFARFGLPMQLHSDQGRNFESKLVAELTKLAGIRRTRTTPFHPRSDGQVERMNRTILAMLRTTAHDCPQDWLDKPPTILAAYRMTPHSSTGVTPNYAMMAREVRVPCTLIAAPPEEHSPISIPYNLNLRNRMRDAHKRAREATKQSAKTQKSYFDARTKALTFTKGQLVWLYWPKPLLRQQKRKLTRLWFGPYQIVDFKSEVVVQIKHIKTGKMQIVHVDRLMPCTSVTEIVSPRSSSPNTSSPSSRPAQPVVSAAPTFVEHQAPTTAPARQFIIIKAA